MPPISDKVAAMSLVLALGVNLWVVAVALPLALAAHAYALGSYRSAPLAVVALAPLAVLAVGARLRSSVALMAAFPLLALAPQALATAELTARVLPPAASLLAAASLIGFLVAVAHAQARAERPVEAIPPSTRRLRQDAPPSRWRRRLRVYRGLVVTAVLFPTALLGAVDLSPSFASSLESSFGVHAPRAQALATVAVGLLWIVLARSYLIAPLHAHLQHDRDLLAAIEGDRRHARRGRPRPLFYFAVVIALGAMVAVVWQRSR
jgi:hypothetical protein